MDAVDFIKSKQVSSKDALKYIKKRLTHKNPNVQLLSLSLLDVCAKNCGKHFLCELAGRDFVNFLAKFIKTEESMLLEVRGKMMELVQTWALTFKSEPELGYMCEAYETLKSDGVRFPPPSSSIDRSYLETSTAPAWTDSDACTRCQSSFSITNRKHHCRNCGRTFCAACSSQSLPLPHYGINTLARVCDGCYLARVGKMKEGMAKSSNQQPSEITDKELELAIQLSLQDHSVTTLPRLSAQEEDPMLAAAIAASLEEERRRSSFEIERKEKQPEHNGRAKDHIQVGSSSLSKEISSPLSSLSASSSNSRKSEKEAIDSSEKDKIRLFHRLLTKMSEMNGTVYYDAEVQRLYSDLLILSTKLQKLITEETLCKSSLEQSSKRLSEAIKKYDSLLDERLHRYSSSTNLKGNRSFASSGAASAAAAFSIPMTGAHGPNGMMPHPSLPYHPTAMYAAAPASGAWMPHLSPQQPQLQTPAPPISQASSGQQSRQKTAEESRPPAEEKPLIEF